MNRVKPGRKIRAYLAVAASAIVFLITAPAAPASAGTCTTPGCGGMVANGSSVYSIRISNTWCWSDTSGTITYYGDQLPCVTHPNDAYSYNADFELPPRATSSSYYYYYDTDAFRAYRGCVTWGNLDGATFSYDRRGLSSKWIKIYNGQHVNISSITCG